MVLTLFKGVGAVRSIFCPRRYNALLFFCRLPWLETIMNEDYQQNRISQVVWPWLYQKDKEKAQRQSLSIALPILVVAWLIASLFYYLNHPVMSVVIVVISSAVFFLSQFFPSIFAGIELLFQKFSFVIGKSISWLTLPPFFYLFCTSMRSIQLIRKRDLMSREIDRSAESYWQKVDKKNGVERYLRQF